MSVDFLSGHVHFVKLHSHYHVPCRVDVDSEWLPILVVLKLELAALLGLQSLSVDRSN